MISFTDQQILDMSSEYVNYQALRDNLVASLAGSQLVVDTFLEIDVGNKQFTDFYRSVCDNYNIELGYYNEDSRTSLTAESQIDEGGQRTELFYPASPPNVWAKLPPKMQDSNNANPRSAHVGPYEQPFMIDVEDAIYNILNGSPDLGSTTVETTYSGGATIRVDDVSAIPLNSVIFAFDGSEYLVAEVISITQDPGFCTGETPSGSGVDEATCLANGGTWNLPPEGELGINVIDYSGGSITAGSTVSTEVLPFTNAERTETVVMTPIRLAVLSIYKSAIDNTVTALESWYDTNSIPNLNTSLNDIKNKTATQDQIAKVNAIKTAIDTWQSFPSDTLSSRFNDTNLANISSAIDTRQTEIPLRVTELNDILGSVAQNPDGTYTGSGHYYDFFDWLNKRINAATGSLAKYYGSSFSLIAIQQQIDNLDSNRVEQESYLRIEAFLANMPNTTTIPVADETGFSALDAVKICANDKPIINTTIVSVSAGQIVVADNIPTDYNLSSQGRIVKQLS